MDFWRDEKFILDKPKRNVSREPDGQLLVIIGERGKMGANQAFLTAGTSSKMLNITTKMSSVVFQCHDLVTAE